MKWYFKVWKDYATFNGRARRKEYWMFTLFNSIIGWAIVLLNELNYEIIFEIITTLYFLAVIIPSLAVCVRRLHDIGKSGWWYFINFIPFIGSIWFFILSITDSQPGENKYGLNPKEFPNEN